MSRACQTSPAHSAEHLWGNHRRSDLKDRFSSSPRTKASARRTRCRQRASFPRQPSRGAVEISVQPRHDPNCFDGNPDPNGASCLSASSAQFAALTLPRLTPAQYSSLDQGCSSSGTCLATPGMRWARAELIANIGGANPNALFTQYPSPTAPIRQRHQRRRRPAELVAVTRFPATIRSNTIPILLNWTTKSRQTATIRSFFAATCRTIIRNASAVSRPAPQRFLTNNSKGIAAGYTGSAQQSDQQLPLCIYPPGVGRCWPEQSAL